MNARQEWLDQRRTGIGGSDAAAVLGLSKWKTPHEVWLEKMGQAAPTPDNTDMLIGRMLEPEIRQQYADRTGRVVHLNVDMLRHQTLPFMVANLDGFTDDRRLFEAKTARSGPEWGEPGSDQIPQTYLIQVQHYLMVTGFEVADVAVLFKDRRDPNIELYEVPADRELQEMIADGEADFWKLVQQGIPPEPISFAEVQARFGRSSKPGNVLATPELEAALIHLTGVREQLKALEATEQEQLGILQKAMGEMDTLVDSSGRTLVTWKAAKPSQRFDASAFKAAHPALHAEFMKIGEASRRFLIK